MRCSASSAAEREIPYGTLVAQGVPGVGLAKMASAQPLSDPYDLRRKPLAASEAAPVQFLGRAL
jgi:hypothetical protein